VYQSSGSSITLSTTNIRTIFNIYKISGNSCIEISTPNLGCTSDSQCKSGRICKNGDCVYPDNLSNNSDNNLTNNKTSEIRKCIISLTCPIGEVCINKTCVKKLITNKTNTDNKINESLDTNYEKDYDIHLDENTGELIVIKDGEIQVGPATLKNCSQIKGTPCSSEGYICNGEFVYTSDTNCCVGTCVKQEKTNTKLIGWIIIGVIFFIFIIFLSKYKKTNKKEYSFSELGKRRR